MGHGGRTRYQPSARFPPISQTAISCHVFSPFTFLLYHSPTSLTGNHLTPGRAISRPDAHSWPMAQPGGASPSGYTATAQPLRLPTSRNVKRLLRYHMMLLLRSQLKVTFIIKCSRLLSRGSSQAGSRTSGPGLSPLDEGLRGHLGRQVPDPGPSHGSPWSCRAATRHRADLTRASTLCLRQTGPRLSVETSRGFLSSQKLQSMAPFHSFLFSRRFQRLPHVYPPVPADIQKGSTH